MAHPVFTAKQARYFNFVFFFQITTATFSAFYINESVSVRKLLEVSTSKKCEQRLIAFKADLVFKSCKICDNFTHGVVDRPKNCEETEDSLCEKIVNCQDLGKVIL